MSEFGEIFADPLTTTVYLAASVAFLLVLATEAIVLISQPAASRKIVNLSWQDV